jgi:YVTN family beta-propeller protein
VGALSARQWRFVARRGLAAFVVSTLVGLLVWFLFVRGDDSTVQTAAAEPTAVVANGDAATEGTSGTAATPTTTTTTTTTTAPGLADDGKTASQRQMSKLTTITDGPLRPKSVVATGDGRFIAQNMMYAHSVTVYDRSFQLVKKIDDRIDPAALNIAGEAGSLQGSPVEAAIAPDRSVAWVSNYQMYGPGYTNPGDDKCGDTGRWDDSYLYRINLASLAIDAAVKVGPVPKYVAVTPDGATVLVTNWCGYDMSVVDVATLTETARIPIGRFPRGIAVSPDGTLAYVAVMGSTDIAVVDLATQQLSWIRGVGQGPRHLVLSPDGSILYATLNSAGKVAKIDTRTRAVVATVASPKAPRSMAISDDGTALYVVNYESDAVSKIDTATMTEVQRVGVGHHPIGITYDAAARQIWVACYVGQLVVLQDA